MLLQTGMSLDQILDMSFEQISVCSTAVYKQKINMLEMVFEPISVMLGGKPKKKKKTQKTDSDIAKLSPEQKAKYNQTRDAKLMFELQKAGLRVTTE